MNSEYNVGALSGQNGWANSFSVDATVTSTFARTGSRSLEIRQLSGQDPYGLTVRVGPFPQRYHRFPSNTRFILLGRQDGIPLLHSCRHNPWV